MSRKEKRAVPLLIADLVQAAREIAEYAAIERGDFLANRMRQRAVIQCFEVIGEATKKLPAFSGRTPCASLALHGGVSRQAHSRLFRGRLGLGVEHCNPRDSRNDSVAGKTRQPAH
ncbi:DUF86 domain-containing protein [Aromatoleum buckelii]|nr:HepT-like ribonuclease domain-containing protein [Aromatoleum buckelii]MCK0510127.1 DUF86 domain-containing protein [Aromatoleum buckelii]